MDFRVLAETAYENISQDSKDKMDMISVVSVLSNIEIHNAFCIENAMSVSFYMNKYDGPDDMLFFINFRFDLNRYNMFLNKKDSKKYDIDTNYYTTNLNKMLDKMYELLTLYSSN
ncbi:hypothetical protein D3C87_80890 [compost metagenome]